MSHLSEAVGKHDKCAIHLKMYDVDDDDDYNKKKLLSLFVCVFLWPLVRKTKAFQNDVCLCIMSELYFVYLFLCCSNSFP